MGTLGTLTVGGTMSWFRDAAVARVRAVVVASLIMKLVMTHWGYIFFDKSSCIDSERLLLKAKNLSAVPLHCCGLLLVPVPMGWAVHELLWASFSFGLIAAGYAQFGLCLVWY